eukprot:COSAG01_NODE_53276_length_340_cov_1.045643_1_plen_33_part_01
MAAAAATPRGDFGESRRVISSGRDGAFVFHGAA